MISAEEILAAYPGCDKIVAYSELILSDDSVEGESCFDVMRNADPPLTVDGWIRCVRKVLEAEREPGFVAALAQIDHPNYRRYLAAKMGSL